jgi:hypothetical protein
MDAASAPRLLHEIFAATAQQHASRIAVDVTPGIGRPLRQTRTYQELQRDAAAVASALLAARGERTVAILLSLVTREKNADLAFDEMQQRILLGPVQPTTSEPARAKSAA